MTASAHLPASAATASADDAPGRLRIFRQRIDTACTVRIVHDWSSLEAHVELDDGLLPQAGDGVRVHSAPLSIPFGESATFRRPATLTRGSIFDRAWARFKAAFLLTELYEVSFTPDLIDRRT